MPTAKNTEQIEVSPIVAVDERVITLDGTRVADTQTQGQAAQVDELAKKVALQLEDHIEQIVNIGQLGRYSVRARFLMAVGLNAEPGH